jgi:2'-5' RNA ligase
VTRAFVAVRVPDVVLDAVERRVSTVSIPGRRTTREQWHLTLQFLGDHADVDAVTTALEALEAPGGVARLGGAGAFPDARHARVLWIGMSEGATLLTRIAAAVAERTAALGHVADERPFGPHLTLARCRVPTDLRPAVAGIGAEPVGPPWDVDEVVVYESRRLADGAQYVERAVVPLAR